MTQHRETTGGPSSLRPPPAPAILEARMGYHRLLLAMAVVVLGASFVLPAPDNTGNVRLPGFETALPTFCMLKREYNIDCPGCGLTRCFLSMGHGQVASAWDYHPTGVPLFVLLVAQIPYRLYQIRRLRRGRPEFAHWALLPLLWLFVIAILGQWVLRVTGILVM